MKEKAPQLSEAFIEREMVLFSSTPDRIRTYDLMLRRHALYPAELRAHYR